MKTALIGATGFVVSIILKKLGSRPSFPLTERELHDLTSYMLSLTQGR